MHAKRTEPSFLLLPSITWESVNAHITMEAFFAEARHVIFGPGQHIWSAPRHKREAHAFRSVKARVTTSELGKEMCADENEDR